MKTGETHSKAAYAKSRNQSVFSDEDALLSRKGRSQIEVENASASACGR